MTKPNKKLLETYRQMAKTSHDSMKAKIEANLKATCDKYAGHEDRLDDCIEYLTNCAREILGGKNGEVDNETCFRICRDYFNDELWAKEDQEKAEAQKKSENVAKKAKKEKTAKKAAKAPKMTAAQVEKEAVEKENARIEKLKEKHGLKQAEEPKPEPAPEPVQIKPTGIQPEPGQLDFFALMGV